MYISIIHLTRILVIYLKFNHKKHPFDDESTQKIVPFQLSIQVVLTVVLYNLLFSLRRPNLP